MQNLFSGNPGCDSQSFPRCGCHGAYPPGLATDSLGDDRCSPHLVASGLCLLATELLAIGVQQVGVCQIEHRGKWRHCSVEEGTARADSVNVKLDAECQGSVSQFYWHHKSLWTSPVQVFRSDQVHYNDVGNLQLYRSIRGGSLRHCADMTRQSSTEVAVRRMFGRGRSV